MIKLNRIKVGRKVCLSKDNKAELYEIKSILSDSLCLVHIRSGSLYYISRDEPLYESSPQQLENGKNNLPSAAFSA